MSLLRAAVRLAPSLLRGTELGAMQAEFYGAVYAHLAGAGTRFMNFGHAPADPAMPRLPETEAEPFQAALYWEVLKAGAGTLGGAPARLFEVSCGRGGGLRLAAEAFPAAHLLGLDRQPAAVAAARALLGPRATLLVGDGLALPVAPRSAEMMVSVEAMMNLGRYRFLAEVRRVLAPGGVLAVTGSWRGRPDGLVRRLEHEAGLARLHVALLRDISDAVLESCRQDAPRRQRLVRAAPWPVRRRMADFAALPGTPTFEAYAAGRRTYYLAVLRRPF